LLFPDERRQQHCWTTIHKLLRLAMFVVSNTVWPSSSLKHILGSGTFWIVAVAHTGASMVRTSERVLASYFVATNASSISKDQAASLTVWHSVGTVAGLLIAGQAFAAVGNNQEQQQQRTRKWMVSRLYMASIVSCYVLAMTAIPVVHGLAPDFFVVVQVMAVVTATFGVAVQSYHIPSLVAAASSFGCDKGLYLAYTDGVGYGLSSLVWQFVSRAIQRHPTADDNDQGGGGWAYGWAAVALLLILSAILMVEFMEHYFCRPTRHGGTYETIILA